MDNIAVVFSKQGVRIYHGINPSDYVGRRDVLINPKFPNGIPPHLWEKKGNEITVKKETLDNAISKQKFFTKRDYIMCTIMLLSIATIIYLSYKYV